MKQALLVLLLILTGGFSGCGDDQNAPSPSTGSIRAFVSIAPQAYIVERIGGEAVTVEVLVPPAQSPATYEPSPRQMAALEEADVYFRIGVPFEDRFMDRITEQFGAERVIDMREGIRLRTIEEHSHGDHAAHEPALAGERRDPHTWLDPILVKTQARTVTEALSGLAKEQSAVFEANYMMLAEDLDSVDAIIDSILASFEGRSLFVFHPSYGYFCDRYGLQQVAIESGGKEPSPQELQKMIAEARQANVRAILVQQQFSTAAAQAVAQAIGAEIVVVDPLARDYLNNLMDIARSIAGVYRENP